MKGNDLLAQFLKARGIAKIELARAVGVVPSAVSIWLHGSRPRALFRHKIERFTAGVVPADAWLTPEERKQIQGVQPWKAARKRTGTDD